MSMKIIVSDEIASWIATYGSDSSVVWQRHLDAGILVVETMPFHILVRWGMPTQNEENVESIKSLLEDGLITDDLFPKTKDGEAIRWSQV